MTITTTNRDTAEARARARGPSVTVTAEPLTYDERSNPSHSFFADCWRAKMSDEGATERLGRHRDEMDVELRARRSRPQERRTRGDLIVNYERRSIDLTPGAGGFSVPPLWLVDQTSTMPRPERTLAGLIPSLPLARGVSSVNVPRIVTGTSTGVTPPSTPVSDTDITDAATSSQCVQIAGHADVALQLIEQSGKGGASFDQVVWRDLTSSYDAQLEYQLVAGAGGTGPYSQLSGLINVTGAGSVTYTSASPTAMGAYAYVGQTLGTVADVRKVKPECLLMRFGRWVWFTTSEDLEGRPLGVPDAHNPAPITPDGVPDPIGSLVNVPVFGSEAVPTTLGTAANADVVIACRPSDFLLWEAEPTLNVFEEVLSGTLEGRIQLRRYCAAILGRLPSGICTLGGTGLAVQTNE